MQYKKVTSHNKKWFFLLRYDDLTEGLEMWSTRNLKWRYFDYHESKSLQGILEDRELCSDISADEVESIIKAYL